MALPCKAIRRPHNARAFNWGIILVCHMENVFLLSLSTWRSTTETHLSGRDIRSKHSQTTISNLACLFTCSRLWVQPANLKNARVEYLDILKGSSLQIQEKINVCIKRLSAACLPGGDVHVVQLPRYVVPQHSLIIALDFKYR